MGGDRVGGGGGKKGSSLKSILSFELICIETGMGHISPWSVGAGIMTGKHHLVLHIGFPFQSWVRGHGSRWLLGFLIDPLPGYGSCSYLQGGTLHAIPLLCVLGRRIMDFGGRAGVTCVTRAPNLTLLHVAFSSGVPREINVSYDPRMVIENARSMP